MLLSIGQSTCSHYLVLLLAFTMPLLTAIHFRHHLHHFETVEISYNAAAADFSATDLVCKILPTKLNRNKMVVWIAFCLKNKKDWTLEVYAGMKSIGEPSWKKMDGAICWFIILILLYIFFYIFFFTIC